MRGLFRTSSGEENRSRKVSWASDIPRIAQKRSKTRDADSIKSISILIDVKKNAFVRKKADSSLPFQVHAPRMTVASAAGPNEYTKSRTLSITSREASGRKLSIFRLFAEWEDHVQRS